MLWTHKINWRRASHTQAQVLHAKGSNLDWLMLPTVKSIRIAVKTQVQTGKSVLNGNSRWCISNYPVEPVFLISYQINILLSGLIQQLNIVVRTYIFVEIRMRKMHITNVVLLLIRVALATSSFLMYFCGLNQEESIISIWNIQEYHHSIAFRFCVCLLSCILSCAQQRCLLLLPQVRNQ